jgi:sugar/nucleoside kinase (ribokinase family)
MRVLVIGDLYLDSVAYAGGVPAGKSLGHDDIDVWMPVIADECGGSALHFALAALRCGLAAAIVGCVGNDWAGDYLLDHIRSAGIDDAVSRTDRGPTGRALLAHFDGGSRLMLASRPNANDLLPRPGPAAGAEDADIAWITGQTIRNRNADRYEAVIEYTRRARAAGTKIVLDLVPHDIYNFYRDLDEILAAIGPVDGVASAMSTARRLLHLAPVPEAAEALEDTAMAALQSVRFAILTYRIGTEHTQLVVSRAGWRDFSTHEIDAGEARGFGEAQACRALMSTRDGLHVWQQ